MIKLKGTSTVSELMKAVAAVGKHQPGPVRMDVEIGKRRLTLRFEVVAVDGVPVESSEGAQQVH